jgi:hypothetical protein
MSLPLPDREAAASVGAWALGCECLTLALRDAVLEPLDGN